MTNNKLEIRERKLQHLLKAAAWSSTILFLVFLLFNLLYLDKTFPNTYFAGIDVSGKNEGQISGIVANYIENKERRKIKISVSGEIIEFEPAELGIKFYIEDSIEEIADTYRAASLIDYLGKRFSGIVVEKRIGPSYSVDFSKFSNAVESKLEALEKGAVNSTIVFDAHRASILEEEQGIVVDRGRLVKDLIRNLDDFSSDIVTASYVLDEPKVKAKNAQAALEKIKELDDQQIILSSGFDTWQLGGENLLSVVDFYPKRDSQLMQISLGARPIVLKELFYEERADQILEVRLNEKSLNSFIGQIASTIDKPKIDATLEFDGKLVSKFTPAQDGRKLNKAKVKNFILGVVSIDKPQVEKNLVFNLPVEVTKAKIANDEINSLGIKELIASGISYFTGSIPNRAFNIGLGSQLINGTVVPPGETFSFNKLVGPVSSEQGFKEAYVISRGRTVLDDGGGICQVSTTVFRAALNAGLPIVERTAHAYRVAYYEQRGFEPGFDATIWSPTVDLKFKNDTGHHILVQATVDRAQSKLQIDIYGTSDGRRVEISNPILTGRKSAPEPKYENDPTLPAGTIKQVDFAAEGLTSVFERKVYRDNELAIEDTFKSAFRPWQAVYLVGTGG